ncbi:MULTISPECIES: hypothetical protein [Sphingobacterium]|uniref:hypothetical protein n=1 Tax=Sphingobacterium TaxID=28453 RepID=UPI0028A6E4B7|nr:hypothetical protein [Sphingobacterium multivorum]
MSTKLRIISHEIVKEGYLRLDVVYKSRSCGTIDIIAEKINFNIPGKYFFKGMEAIKNIELEYTEGELVFTFRNRKSLAFSCDMTAFTAISMYIKSFQ